jgi:hypothetical protein
MDMSTHFYGITTTDLYTTVPERTPDRTAVHKKSVRAFRGGDE